MMIRDLLDRNDPLHFVLAVFIVMFAGWTLGVHACVLSGWSLDTLLWVGPLGVVVLMSVYWSAAAHDRKSTVRRQPVVFHPNISWPSPTSGGGRAVLVCAAIMVMLTLGVTRSDLDDAFYAAVAAHAVGAPGAPLLAYDPMLGDPGLPLLFPSYRFSSFELLSAAMARGLGFDVLDAYYVVIPTAMAVVATVASFLLGRVLFPRRWVWVGVATLAMVLLFGEMHRSPANFSFGRLYQGKAVFVSVLIPSLYYLTHRFLSPHGRSQDGWLLACALVSSVGMTNFGMLAAPLAVGAAIVSNLSQWQRVGGARFAVAVACLLIPFPYLTAVALQAGGSPLLSLPSETPLQVWRSVFGDHQLYLLSALLVAGPLLAKDQLARWRLAVPVLILLGVYLNPWLSRWIALYVTSPPVYWRVTWTAPLLGFAGCAWVLVLDRATGTMGHVGTARVLMGLLFFLLFVALPYHTLRPSNRDDITRWAGWKVPQRDLKVANTVVALHRDDGRVLAPDEIAGVVSRFVRAPKLVSARAHYIDLLGQEMHPEELAQRKLMHGLVSGSGILGEDVLKAALFDLDVTTVVLASAHAQPNVVSLLKAANLEPVSQVLGYQIWRQKRP